MREHCLTVEGVEDKRQRRNPAAQAASSALSAFIDSLRGPM